MELIANHFSDSSLEIRGFALEFYIILTEMYLDFSESNQEHISQYLQNPQKFQKNSKIILSTN
jgi:hypothetical protein